MVIAGERFALERGELPVPDTTSRKKSQKALPAPSNGAPASE